MGKFRDDYCKWSVEQEATLREMWGRGLPASAIAAALGLSRGAITAKARRLALRERESPIKKALRLSRIRRRPHHQPPLSPPPSASLPPTLPIAPSKTCCWVLEHTLHHVRYCNAPAVPGKSWCAAHAARVFDPSAPVQAEICDV